MLAGASGLAKTVESGGFWPYMLLRILLVLVSVAVLGAMLWLEARPSRPRAVEVRTQAGSQGRVTVDSVERRLAWHIDQIEDVIWVAPHVSPRGRTVNVLLEVQTSPEIDVPAKTDEVVNVARQVLTERMGLQPGKVEVHIEHAPYEQEADEAWTTA
jgi:hypothetical protein